MSLSGPNGRLPEEITAMYPNSPIVRRNGEVNAWDNEEFRQAVKATGKKQVVLAGIVTDVSPLTRLWKAYTKHSLGLHGIPRLVARRRRLHSLSQLRGVRYLQPARR